MSCLNRCYFVFLWFYFLLLSNYGVVKSRKLHSFFSAYSNHKPPLGIPQDKSCTWPIKIKKNEMIHAARILEYSFCPSVLTVRGQVWQIIRFVYKKWSHFVKMLLLTDLFLLFKWWRFNCKVPEWEMHVFGLSSNRHFPVFLEGV